MNWIWIQEMHENTVCTPFCLYRSLKLSSVLIEILLDRPVKEVNLMKELFAQKLLRITS